MIPTHDNIVRLRGNAWRRLKYPFVVVKRGVAARGLPVNEKSWRVIHWIACVRVLAVASTTKDGGVFTHESAMLMHGLSPWESNPNVSIRGTAMTRRAPLYEIVLRDWVIPAAEVVPTYISIRGDSGDSAAVPIREGVRVDSLSITAVIMALTRPPIEAMVAVCAVLRRQCAASAYSRQATAIRQESYRTDLLHLLNSGRAERKCLRGYRQAKMIIENASALCENRAEAALYWILLTIFGEEVVPQFELVVYGKRRFVDFAVERLRLLLEFDGTDKLGSNSEEFHHAQRDFLIRQQELEGAGWQVVRFRWADLFHPDVIRERIMRALYCRHERIGVSDSADKFRQLETRWICRLNAGNDEVG